MPAHYQYAEDELGGIRITVKDASGTIVPGAHVYMTDSEWEYEDFLETGSDGKIFISPLHASEFHSYQFYTFIDGYAIQNWTDGIRPGSVGEITLRPDPENRQNLSIDVIGDCHFPCTNRLVFTVTVSGIGEGTSYADVIAYDADGNVIRDFCEPSEKYGVLPNSTWGWSPWLGYGHDLRKLSDAQRAWLTERGGMCLGDLKDVGGTCGYFSYGNPMLKREEAAYKPVCPSGGIHRMYQGRTKYLGIIQLPKETERVAIRAVGIDSDGDFKVVEKALTRQAVSRLQDWPCCASPIALGVLLASGIVCAASRLMRAIPFQRGKISAMKARLPQNCYTCL